MNKMEELMIRNKLELEQLDSVRIREMTEHFSLEDFLNLQKCIGVIAITPKQVIAIYALQRINDGTECGYYTFHQNYIDIIRKCIYGSSDFPSQCDPMISFNCAFNQNELSCISAVLQRRGNMIFTKSMYEIFNLFHDQAQDLDTRIRFPGWDEFNGISQTNSQIDELSLLDESIIGVSHSDFIKILNHRKKDGLGDVLGSSIGLETLQAITPKMLGTQKENGKGEL